jgi:hypothetical protein
MLFTSNQDNNDIAIFAQQAFTFQMFWKKLGWEHWTKPQWQAGNGFDMVWWTYAPNGVRVPQCFETLARFGKLEASEKYATHLLTDFWLVVWKSFYIGNTASFMMMPIDQLMFSEWWLNYFVDFKSIVFPLWGAVGYVTTVIGYRGYITTFGVNYHGYTCQLPQLQPHSTDVKPSPHIQPVGWVMAQIPADYQLYHFKSGAGRCQGGNGAWMRLQWWKWSNERRSASQLTRCFENNIDVFWMNDQPDVCMEWFPDGFNSILWMFGLKIGTGKNFPFCWISNYT